MHGITSNQNKDAQGFLDPKAIGQAKQVHCIDIKKTNSRTVLILENVLSHENSKKQMDIMKLEQSLIDTKTSQ